MLFASCGGVLCSLKHHGSLLFHLFQIICTHHFRSSCMTVKSRCTGIFHYTRISIKCTKTGIAAPNILLKQLPIGRGEGSWWGCSDSSSDSDSGLLTDSGSYSDSGSDTKYKINNTLIVGQVSAAQAKKKKRDISIDFGLHSFGRKIFIPVIVPA